LYGIEATEIPGHDENSQVDPDRVHFGWATFSLLEQ
jgi:hypothetical protein